MNELIATLMSVPQAILAVILIIEKLHKDPPEND